MPSNKILDRKVKLPRITAAILTQYRYVSNNEASTPQPSRASVERYHMVRSYKLTLNRISYVSIIQESKFYVGQKVWLTVPGYNSLRGPYWVEDVVGGGKYTLCHENGNTVDEHGEVIEENLTAFQSSN